MAQAIPLVRAIALGPSLRWIAKQGLPLDMLLRQNDLTSIPYSSPYRPVPFLKVGTLLRDIAALSGPDAPCRIVSETTDTDLVQIGKVVLGTKTPAEALARISMTLPFFCSHETLSVEPNDSGLRVRHTYERPFEHVVQHLMYQYALAVLDRICAMTGAPQPRINQVQIAPHPDVGLGHLNPWFGAADIQATRANTLTLALPGNVAFRPFPRPGRDRTAQLMQAGLQPLRNGGNFSASVQTLMTAILENEEVTPTLQRVADAGGLSTRSLQRRLQEEGNNFKSLLDDVRGQQARALIENGSDSIAGVSERLGYARATSLNRSMLRWVGAPPSSLRSG